MIKELEPLEKLITEKNKQIRTLQSLNSDLESQVEDAYMENDRGDEIYDLEQEVADLEKRDVYPRREITLPELMKFEFLKDNWDKISLEDLENLVQC
jgi:hypothetical protein